MATSTATGATAAENGAVTVVAIRGNCSGRGERAAADRSDPPARVLIHGSCGCGRYEEFAWSDEAVVGLELPQRLLDLVPHGGPVGLRYAGEHLVQGAEGLPLESDALGRRRQPQG